MRVDPDQVSHREVMIDDADKHREISIMTRPEEIKWMTFGEGSLAAFFAASVFVCLFAAAKAEDAARDAYSVVFSTKAYP